MHRVLKRLDAPSTETPRCTEYWNASMYRVLKRLDAPSTETPRCTEYWNASMQRVLKRIDAPSTETPRCTEYWDASTHRVLRRLDAPSTETPRCIKAPRYSWAIEYVCTTVTPVSLSYLTTLYHLHRFIALGYYELDTAASYYGVTKYSRFNPPPSCDWVEPSRNNGNLDAAQSQPKPYHNHGKVVSFSKSLKHERDCNLVNKANLVHSFSLYVYFFSLHVSGDYVPAYQTVIHTE